MNPSNSETKILTEGTTCAASGDVFAKVDTKGYDYMVLEILAGTWSAAETSIEILRVGESDSDPSDVTTDCDILPGFSCAAAACATADNILPPGSSTKQNIYRFNMDLRGRKRYIALDFCPVLQVPGVAFLAHLFRNNIGDEPLTTQATTADGFRFIASG